jgi:hypothetical protein
MFRGDWGKFAKIAGLATLILMGALFTYAATIPYGQSLKQEAANKAYIERQNAEYTIKWVCSSSLAEKDCVAKARQTENENNRNAEDLSAQKLSAWWSQVMAVAALIGMGLSAVGVWLVKTTFDEARKANQISQDAMDSQHRPTMVFEGHDIDRVDLEKIIIKASWRNIGNSPATIVESGISRKFVAAEAKSSFDQIRLKDSTNTNTIREIVRVEMFASSLGMAIHADALARIKGLDHEAARVLVEQKSSVATADLPMKDYINGQCEIVSWVKYRSVFFGENAKEYLSRNISIFGFSLMDNGQVMLQRLGRAMPSDEMT